MTRRSVITCDHCNQDVDGVSAEQHAARQTWNVRDNDKFRVTADLEFWIRRQEKRPGASGEQLADVCDPCRAKLINEAASRLLEIARQMTTEGSSQ